MAMLTKSDVLNGLQKPINWSTSFISNAANAAGACKTSWVAGNSFIYPSGATGGNTGGTFDTTINGVTVTGPINGAFTYTNPSSGNFYIARMTCKPAEGSQAPQTFTTGLAILCDRLWQNGGMNVGITTPQLITSPAWPLRDNNSSNSGDGVLIAVEFSSAYTISTTPTITISYTNTGGTSGRTGTNVFPVATHTTGAAHLIGLQDNDIGVKSVESITISASMTQGTMNLVAYRPITVMQFGLNEQQGIDAITGGLPRILDNSALFFLQITGNSAADGALGSIAGTITPTWG